MSDPDLSFAIVSKNLVDAGTETDPPKETAELRYTGNIAVLKQVTVELLEVDPGENRGAATVRIAKLEGEIVARSPGVAGEPPGDFKLTKEPKDKLPADQPRFQLKVGAKTLSIGLPGLDAEAGRRFEVRLRASATPSKGKSLTFTSKAELLVRFGRFAKEARAPVLAFITGAESDVFFKTATVFWHQHADLVKVQKGMSLREIVDFLAANHKRVMAETGDKGWGEVNIVCHGNPISAAISIVPGGPPNLRLTELEDLLDAQPNAFSETDIGLGSDSRVVFRSCNIGKRSDLLKVVRKQIFADKCVVKAPKLLQQYSTAPGKSSTRAASEGFVEELRLHLRQSNLPTDAQATAAIKARFPARSDDEIKSFATRKIDAVKSDLTRTTRQAETVVDISGSGLPPPTTPQDLLKKRLDAASSTDRFDFLGSAQWKLEPVQTLETTSTELLEVQAQATGSEPKRAVTASGGTIGVGTGSIVDDAIAKRPSGELPSVIRSAALGFATDELLRIEATSDTGFAINADGSGKFSSAQLGVKNVSSASGSVSGTARVQVKAGTETLVVGRALTVKIKLPVTRVLVSFRRELRQADPADPTKTRAVLPDIDKSAHYGSSEDPALSLAELRKLND